MSTWEDVMLIHQLELEMHNQGGAGIRIPIRLRFQILMHINDIC